MAQPSFVQDPRPALFAAVDQILDLTGEVVADQLTLPTPCAEYSVADLLGHVLGVATRVARCVDGSDTTGLPEIIKPDSGSAVSDWVDALGEQFDVARHAWTDDAVLTSDLIWAFGVDPGSTVARVYTGEIAAHTWDLRRAIGSGTPLDQGIGELALAVARDMIPAHTRGGAMPFGPVVEVPSDVDVYDQLAGWVGRTV